MHAVQNEYAKRKILLWDIDGTLILSTTRGSYKLYFASTMQKVFGSSGDLEAVMPSGMTDTQIMYESLKNKGFTPEKILSKRDVLLRTFKEEMLKVHESGKESYRVLEGVEEILTATLQKQNFVNALLTGNLSVAAEIKLRSVGLWNYFIDSLNVFGEVSCNRKDLAFEALRRFRERYKFNFSPSQFVIIGDTPNDISAARAIGAKVLSVATGRVHGKEDLLKHKPDALVESLKDTEQVLEILENL
ncbi:MAG: hydrolase [Pyrinomonadaceae bacterium]|nr:MAG: hydrolase [Pyrinomonadaceae bacterium]